MERVDKRERDNLGNETPEVASGRTTSLHIPAEEEASQDELTGEVVSLLALMSLDGVGYWTLWRLKKNGHKLKDVLRMDSLEDLHAVLRSVGARLSDDRLIGWPEARQEIWSHANTKLKQLKRDGIRLLLRDDPRFPPLLRTIPDSPEWLFIQGSVKSLNVPSVAIVGTRKPTQDGLFLASYVSALVARMGLCIVSGLASGIDSVVHQNAVRYEARTVAFLGTGIEFQLSAPSEELRRKICARGGTVASEYLPTQRYSAENFVRRNRLQAGLATVVIPVEWRRNSGTAHTVRFAEAFGRRLIGVRMPDWPLDRQELMLLRSMAAPILTIPGEEALLVQAIRDGLNQDRPQTAQLRLF